MNRKAKRNSFVLLDVHTDLLVTTIQTTLQQNRSMKKLASIVYTIGCFIGIYIHVSHAAEDKDKESSPAVEKVKLPPKYGHGSEGVTDDSPSAPADQPMVIPSVPAVPPKIVVSLDKQTLTWEGPMDADGVYWKSFEISSGKLTTPTPTGEFTILKKEKSYLLREPLSKQGVKVYMPWWMTIDVTRGIAIHGVKNIWGGTYPGSGACIRMRELDAEWLFERVSEGTPVIITGSTEAYVEENHVFPWQQPEVKDLLVSRPGGTYGFQKEVTDDMRLTLEKLWAEKKLGVFRPSPKLIKKDPRWKKGQFINFPNIPEMGSPSEQSFDECSKRYFTLRELEAIVGRIIKVDP